MMTRDPYINEELLHDSGAIISTCEHYRYRLWRSWGDGAGGFAVFLMLNPSTADATIDDPTIRKCVGFAKRWSMSGIRVVNLFGLRATDPRELALTARIDAIGVENSDHLWHVLSGHASGGEQRIVCAWGATGGTAVKTMVRERLVVVGRLLRELNVAAYCLGRSKDGSPRHPLMLPYGTPLEPWSSVGRDA
jgi:hypothetical protein